MKKFWIIVCLLSALNLEAQRDEITVPAVHSHIHQDKKGLYLELDDGRKLYEKKSSTNRLTLAAIQGNVRGTKKGVIFDFGDVLPRGTMYYGFIAKGDSKHPQPVFFKKTAKIREGKVEIPIAEMKGKYDMIGWEEAGKGLLGYRIMDDQGRLIYDGRVNFSGRGPFSIAPTLIEGPVVDQIEPDQLVISFQTLPPAPAAVHVDGRVFESELGIFHEIKIDGLGANQSYDYAVVYGDDTTQNYSFLTAPRAGSRSDFTFAYASDSRSGQGGGERDVYGANFYIMKKIMALAMQQKVAFMQFSGDLINGYSDSPGETELQYANWKRAVEPFTHYLPIYEAMGNHEALTRKFDRKTGRSIAVDRFPYATESAEAVFARNFSNPTNGLKSEDGAAYDPNPDAEDFPSYEENVFFYTYDNVAMVVLNSDYFYSPTTSYIPWMGGGVHGYIMDRQMEWFEETMNSLEAEDEIDHIFVSLHTPFFPNGGHVHDDMWYHGNNDIRPFVNGEPLRKGIIERRDELLEVIVNQSEKALAILTGDEHNFAVTRVSPDMPRYPESYAEETIELGRTVFQINNGAAGAPYYSQEQTPWSDWVEGFTTQNALVLIHVSGDSVTMEVLNPDTLEEIYSLRLRE